MASTKSKNVLKKGTFDPLFDFVGKEKDVELHIIDNIHEIAKHCNWGEVVRIERQFMIRYGKGSICADIMVWHKDGSGTVIEVKRTKTNRNDTLAAIGQVLAYGYKVKEVLTNRPRLVISSPEINEELYRVIQEYKLPIDLLMIDGDRAIYLPETS